MEKRIILHHHKRKKNHFKKVFKIVFESRFLVENIQIYKGGKSTVVGQSNIIKLSSNENALDPSANVYNFIQKKNVLHRYGEINGQSLRTQLSKIHSIEDDQIILGNGSNEILLMGALAFCHPGDEIIHSKYAFEMYPIITKIVGAVSIYAEELNYKVNVDWVYGNSCGLLKNPY